MRYASVDECFGSVYEIHQGEETGLDFLLPTAGAEWSPPPRAAVHKIPDGSVIYFLESHDGRMVKIGTSASGVDRIRNLRSMNAHPLTLRAWLPGSSRVESQWHQRWDAERDHGEWFRLTPGLAAAIDRAWRWAGAADRTALA